MFKLKRPNIDPDPSLIKKVRNYSRIAAVSILICNIAFLIVPYFILGETTLFGSAFATVIISIILLLLTIDYKKYYKVSLGIFIVGTVFTVALLFINPALAFKLIGLNYYPSTFWLILQLINVISVAMLFIDNDEVIYIVQIIQVINILAGFFGVFYFAIGNMVNLNIAFYYLVNHLFVGLLILHTHPDKGFLRYYYTKYTTQHRKLLLFNMFFIICVSLLLMNLVTARIINYELGLSLFAVLNIFVVTLLTFLIVYKENRGLKQIDSISTQLAGASEYYEIILSTLTDSILYADENNKIMYVNRHMKSLIDYDKDKEYLKDYIDKFDDSVYKSFQKSRRLSRPIEVEKWYTIEDSKKDFFLSGWITPIYIKEEYKGNVFSLFDLTSHKKSESLMENMLNEKDALLSEIHHRVKNNLQVINSLLSLQSETIDDEKSKELFTEAQHRIRSMGLVHETFYQTQEFGSMKISTYFSNLVDEITSSYIVNQEIYIDYDIENYDDNTNEIYMDMDNSVPLGLIINEFLTNSIKYAFPDHKGKINILFTKKDDIYRLELKDNGIGIKKFEPGFGFGLIKALIKQLQAKKELKTDNGVELDLEFKI